MDIELKYWKYYADCSNKAGRIVPALATTTASVAGLQTLELVKVLANSKKLAASFSKIEEEMRD